MWCNVLLAAGNLPPDSHFGAEVQNTWSYRPTSTPSLFLLAWFLIMRSGNNTTTVIIIISSSSSSSSNSNSNSSSGPQGLPPCVEEACAVQLHGELCWRERNFSVRPLMPEKLKGRAQTRYNPWSSGKTLMLRNLAEEVRIHTGL
jgi:hypothetical protein